MNRINKRITLLNSISTFILQLVTVVSGFLIPKLILSNFGSEANGLISSLTKFLSYVTIIDGGIAGVVTASLYKPLMEKDYTKISSIIKTTKNFYKKISLIFIIYTLVLGSIYPLCFRNDYNYLFVFSLTIILSTSLAIQYLYSLSIRSLLMADKKIYVISFTQSAILIIGTILAYTSSVIYPSIHIIYLIIGATFIIQPIIYNRVCKKYYKLNNDVKEDNALLKNRWSGFTINLAAFIHSSTDVVLLTIFKGLQSVSIYSVYLIVAGGIRNIIVSLTSSLNPTLGHEYAKNNFTGLKKKIEIYEFIIFNLIFFSFSVASLLIVQFVLIYTNGVNDADYSQPLFAYLLLISEAIYLLKFPHLNLAYSANKYKEISPSGFIEAIINIILSIILIPLYGLVGAAIGTISAMIYRMAYHVWYTKKIIGRSQWVYYKKIIIYAASSAIGIIICSMLPVGSKDTNIINWLACAVEYSGIMTIILIITNMLFYKEDLLYVKSYIFNNNRKHICKK